MTVIRFDPFRDPLERLLSMAATGTRAPLGMPMDVYRAGDGSYHVEADLPGVDPDSVEVTVEHSTLTIRAERTPHYGESEQVIVAERPQGSFTRQLSLGEGVDSENLTADYAPTGLWDTLLGGKVPDSGDPELAKKLIAESGAPMPTLTYDYAKTPDADKSAAALQASLKKAGITLKLNAIEAGKYYSTVLDPKKENELASAGWGPDWSNASTVIPPLFTQDGGFDLSRVNDKAFNAKVTAAKQELDRNKQATMWQELNKEAVAQAWVLPTRFGREQRLAGSKVGNGTGDNGQVYLWAPYGSWAYADLYVKK